MAGFSFSSLFGRRAKIFSQAHAPSEHGARFSPSDDVVGFLASRRIRATEVHQNNNIAAAWAA
jgi:hypothetical protein